MPIDPARRHFLLGQAGRKARVARVHGANCFESRGIVCRRCSDVCDARALRFLPLPGGFAQPLVDPALCTACGECVTACPASAIAIEGDPR